jgi:DNA polymerase III epsilon subunit-like protein
MSEKDLIRFNNSFDYIIIDGESCNLNLQDPNNLAWQFGLLECKGNEIIKENNIYIKWPKLSVSKDAARITRFSMDIIDEKGISPKEAMGILDDYIYNNKYRIIFHNGLRFDVYLHNNCRKSLGIKPDYSYINRTIDTDALAKGIKLNHKYDGANNNDFLAYQYKMSSIVRKGLKTNLTLLGKENGIEFDYENLHNGINDCFLLHLVWNKWIKYNIDI